MTRLCHWLLLLFLAWSCNFCHSFSLTRRAQVSLPYQLHLFSLEWSSLEAISSSTSTTTTIPYSKATRDVWKWKDTVLGDGRDYFIPRPRTLRALQQYLLLNDNDDDESMQVEECVILSNCARFEIFLVTNGSSNEWQQNRDSDNNKADILQERLSRRLIAQCRAYQQEQKSKPFAWSNLPFDRPGNIIADPPPVSNDEENDTLQWKHLDDPTAIARHVCQVAAGLAPRPSRPDRPVIFRPFSSRDAHILLQLKRTLTTFDSNNSSCRRLGQLIRIALQAGKAARNVDRVPALQKLRPYGTGDSSYSSAPPTALMEQVKEVREYAPLYT